MHRDRELIASTLRVDVHQPLFRDEAATSDLDNRFNRNAQIAICAGLLETLRTQSHEKWWALKAKKRGSRDGSSELKLIVSMLIRWSSESVDVSRSVDFITRQTFHLLVMRKKPNGFINLGQLTGLKGFTHEHMVPCEAIFQKITSKKMESVSNGESLAPLEPLEPLLQALSYRALVQKISQKTIDEQGAKTSEHILLNSLWSQSLPKEICLHGKAPRRLSDIEQKFYPLLRYDIVGLLGELMPVNLRAETLLDDYEQMISTSSTL